MRLSEDQRAEHIIRRMQTDNSTDAPQAAIGYAKNLFRVRAAEAAPSLVRRIVAALTIDLAPNKAAFGERSATGGEARQVLFESDEFAVDLRVTKTSTGCNIRGQVLGTGYENAEAQLSDTWNSFKTRLDAASGFKFDGVPFGEYSLAIRTDDAEIFIEKLTLQ